MQKIHFVSILNERNKKKRSETKREKKQKFI